MAVVVMVQSGLLFESKIVITRNGEEVHGFDIIFNFFWQIVAVQAVQSTGDALVVGSDGTVRTVIIVQKLLSPGMAKIFMDLM